MARRPKQKDRSRVVWPGFSYKPPPREVAKIGRNDPCPCGSEKKFKDCHEKEGSAFIARLAKQERRERLKQMREEMKRQGVPWYKRIFFGR